MKTVPELFETLQLQTDALASGTNPIVYFPFGTIRIPELPVNAKSELVEGEGVGDGIYYYNPRFVRAEEIHNAIKTQTLWLLLGFVMSKEDAVKGLPGIVVARTTNGREIKSAVVDTRNARAVVLQKMVLERQFPGSIVALEIPQAVVIERLFLNQGGGLVQ
jgi:hypothetical protein